MVACVAFEVAYQVAGVSAAGYNFTAHVREIVIGTSLGVLHYKFSKNNRAGAGTRIFTDLDSDPRYVGSMTADQLTMHRYFKMTDKNAASYGVRLMRSVMSDTDQVQAELISLLKGDERAINAWNTITGFDTPVTLHEILGSAEKLVHTERQNHLKTRALEMALIDQTWGMF